MVDSEPNPRATPDAGGDLEALLVMHAPWLQRLIERRAGWLLRVDGLDDLVQDVRLRALRAESTFEHLGEGQFKTWLGQVAQNHIVDRQRYWSAARRNAGPMLRLSGVGPPSSLSGTPGLDLTAAGPGPRTWAEARDQHAFATRAIGALLPRDQEILLAVREGATDDELAARLAVEVRAATRARQRALERFRRAYELLVRASPR
ncbi:MAG: sigma factor [Planctomycetota bacterium]